jgi:peroxiredoxin
MVIFRRLLVFLCLFSICFAQHTPRKVADVPIKTTDGKTIRLTQYHGKVVVVVFFLTWCEDCLKTLQFMSGLQKEMGPRGFQVVAVALDDNPAKTGPFAERYRFPFPVGNLSKDPTVKLLDLNATASPMTPYVVFIDWQSNVRFQYPGNDPLFKSAEKNLRTISDGLLRQAAEKKGPQYETRPAGK